MNESSRERWDREDEVREQHAHELEMAKVTKSASVEWARTVCYVLVWGFIIAGICYLNYIGAW